MNEIGWWLLALLAVGMLDGFLERRDRAKGKTCTEDDLARAMMMLTLFGLWGFAAIIRVLFF
jgi:hypothetical protein